MNELNSVTISTKEYLELIDFKRTIEEGKVVKTKTSYGGLTFNPKYGGYVADSYNNTEFYAKEDIIKEIEEAFKKQNDLLEEENNRLKEEQLKLKNMSVSEFKKWRWKRLI